MTARAIGDQRCLPAGVAHDEVTQLFGQIEDMTEARRIAAELEEAQLEMLARLAAAAEFRDDDTGQHTRRVGDLSVTIAQHLGLPEAEIELIRLGAPLHDLGKIAIPDAILGKPGKLTVEEYDQMKAHTTRRRRDARRQPVRAAPDGRADRPDPP